MPEEPTRNAAPSRKEVYDEQGYPGFAGLEAIVRERNETAASTWPLGFSESPEQDWSPRRETSRWIGKPWRRIELLTVRDFWKGEEVGRSRALTIHFGLRRLGLGFTLILMKADVLDYSDEENQ